MKIRRYVGRPFSTPQHYRPRKKTVRTLGSAKKPGRPRSTLAAAQQPGNERACTSCRRVLPLSKFAVDNRCRDGHSRRCKQCTLQKKKPQTAIVKEKNTSSNQEYTKSLSYKRCSTCNRTLPVNAFHKSTKTRDGLRSTCKSCRKANQHDVQVRYQQERARHPITQKTCTACNLNLPITSFYLDKNTKDGYAVYCKDCAKQKQESYVRTWEERRLATPLHIQKKTCGHCHRTLPIDNFPANRNNPDGYGGACKDCERERRNALFTQWQHEQRPLEKQCSRCKKILPASNFSKTKKAKDGLLYMCKDCAATYYNKMKARWARERKRKQMDISLFAVTEKTCRTCQRTLPFNEFYPRKESRDGLNASCKACDAKRAKQQSEIRKARPKIIPTTKTCSLCHKTLSATAFNRSSLRSDGLDNLCRTCRNQKSQDYLTQPGVLEKRLAWQQEYNRRPDVRAKLKKRAIAKAKQRAYQKEYHKRPEVILRQREYMRQYLARKRRAKASVPP